MDNIIAAYTEAFATPLNVFLLLVTIGMLILWYSAHWWQTPDKVHKRAKFFSPRPTQILQEKLRTNATVTKILDFSTMQLWLWAFTMTVVIEVYICGLQGDQAWRYGLPVILSWATSMTIQFLYPVIVPNRWNDFGRELPIIPLRLEQFKSSDNVNGLLYNGLPSNHLGLMLAGAILCYFISLSSPWWVWTAGIVFFILLGIFFCFSVIYLGEHYIWDLIASIVVYVPIMFGVFSILNSLVPMS
ncbi:MAG: phosphatase PAP2 family protein [Candidatus Hodarchaeales archaeon]|jgi:membrane-associated phospholipid phosphatase